MFHPRFGAWPSRAPALGDRSVCADIGAGQHVVVRRLPASGICLCRSITLQAGLVWWGRFARGIQSFNVLRREPARREPCKPTATVAPALAIDRSKNPSSCSVARRRRRQVPLKGVATGRPHRLSAPTLTAVYEPYSPGGNYPGEKQEEEVEIYQIGVLVFGCGGCTLIVAVSCRRTRDGGGNRRGRSGGDRSRRR